MKSWTYNSKFSLSKLINRTHSSWMKLNTCSCDTVGKHSKAKDRKKQHTETHIGKRVTMETFPLACRNLNNQNEWTEYSRWKTTLDDRRAMSMTLYTPSGTIANISPKVHPPSTQWVRRPKKNKNKSMQVGQGWLSVPGSIPISESISTHRRGSRYMWISNSTPQPTWANHHKHLVQSQRMWIKNPFSCR